MVTQDVLKGGSVAITSDVLASGVQEIRRREGCAIVDRIGNGLLEIAVAVGKICLIFRAWVGANLYLPAPVVFKLQLQLPSQSYVLPNTVDGMPVLCRNWIRQNLRDIERFLLVRTAR
jgi:hypothetical protein